MSRRERPL